MIVSIAQADPLCPPPPSNPFFDAGAGLWEFSRYADVLAAFREPNLWPVAPRKTKNFKIPDEAAQHALRAQILAAFSTTQFNEWHAKIAQVADSLPLAGRLDLVSEFAEPWCLAVAEIVTGSAAGDRESLLAAARIVSRAAAEPMDESLRRQATQADAELARYFQASPLPMPGPIFVALSRTVACLLANGWLALLRNPAELARLRANPELTPKAVEEILRYACIPQSVFRYASRSIVLCGLQIAEGDRVILRLASANRDPLQFPEPDRFDIPRSGAAHLSLGFGLHPCAGGALIRMAVTAATKLFVQRFGGVEIRGQVEWEGGSAFLSPSALRVN